MHVKAGRQPAFLREAFYLPLLYAAYVLTFGEAAHGVTAYGSSYEAGQWNNGSRLTFSGGAIFTQGDEAAGARAANGGLITLNDTIISTSGEGASGVMAFRVFEAAAHQRWWATTLALLRPASSSAQAWAVML